MQTLIEYAPHLLSVAALAASAAATTHVVLRKSDVRAAVGWIALIWLSPFVGVALYALLGVNRIRRRAIALTRGRQPYNAPDADVIVTTEEIETYVGSDHLRSLVLVGEANVGRPLLRGNSVQPLYDGDEAYPAMLEAIAGAQRSIALSSYIFDNDATGREFVDALAAARARGVAVRVLVDAAGSRYSFPTIISALKRRGVVAVPFLPSSLIPPYILSFNLRNHRKIMVVDGLVGFTGGMNIREHCRIDRNPKIPTHDLHFRVEGPVVRHLQEVFSEDWTFSTKERLDGESWFPKYETEGSVLARGIPDGPDDDLDKLRWSVLGAIGAAKTSIRIITPYFLPDDSVAEALIVARMRGVKVEVVLPATNNLPYVAWACQGQLGPMLAHGIDVWFVPGHFDHAKLFTVDDAWILLGSPNWDPRSFRLNFEFALECFDLELAEELSRWVRGRIARSARYTLEMHRQRSVPVKLRDGIFRLLVPYL